MALDINAHKNLCIEVHELTVKKDAAYGSSFEKGINKRGLISLLWRLEDKMNRLEELIENEHIDDLGESIRDTLIDIAGYSMLGILEVDKRNKVKPTNIELPKINEYKQYTKGEINDD